MIERVVVIGAGRTTALLVSRLASIATVILVDRSAEALRAVDVTVEPDLPRETPTEVQRYEGDGTSRLVLEDLRGGASTESALVAATGDDRTNLEVCRLGNELGYKLLVAVVIDSSRVGEYSKLGAQTVDRARVLGDRIVQCVRQDGVQVVRSMGLGRGDIIEVQILASSPAIGQTLSMLEPEGWRVAAIYREDRLVLPTGNTMLEPDDRVLLVGEPEILPHIAENLRVGVPSFPLRYGTHVVTYQPRGSEPQIEHEAEMLASFTRARGVVHLR